MILNSLIFIIQGSVTRNMTNFKPQLNKILSKFLQENISLELMKYLWAFISISNHENTKIRRKHLLKYALLSEYELLRCCSFIKKNKQLTCN